MTRVAGGFLALMVVLAVVVLVFTGSGPEGAPEGQKSVAAVRTDSACGMPAGDQTVPLDPIGARWEKVGQYVAPAARSIGPGIRDGHRRLCFAHSPKGAVFAAYNAFAVLSAYNDTAVMRELTAAGQARDAALRAGSPASDPNTLMVPLGFRVTDYSPGQATVVIGYRVMSADGAGLVALTYPMRFERGDWKLVVLPGPDSIQAERLDSAAGLVMFGASS